MKKLSALAIRWIIFIVILGVIAIGYLSFSHFYTFTSDAYVDGHVIGITPEISGTVTQVAIKDGMQVKRGQLLFKIDPRPYQIKLQQDKANLQDAYNQQAQLVASIAAAKADKHAAYLTTQHTKATWQHMAGVARAAFSEQAVKDAKFNYDNARALLDKANHDIAVLQKQLGPRGTPFPAIATAKANIRLDHYNLSKTVVRAPSAGIITNEYLLPGAVVNPQNALFALVEPNHFWVKARFKEGALSHIKVGDKVSVYLKMYGLHKFMGTVANIGLGVNRRQNSNMVVQSSLPYLEQTEDWIQLQQRFPVTIQLQSAPTAMPYRIGASARVFIHR